ncbi:kinesin-domain-containing protein [Gloeophyllum trabeum ATCC 11539]|uniref:Kinesin-domain-containing protein n=1 Tax=Gloeophyllum trabeum (strain ATCC 11539 / FP-39264 / Madison 617) TaxID=670483 RepID=S7S0W8_GLOTA|nr:kinesin-domain-containing protein [Gloeophyllum trabeum ATCC 11539]EPQ59379.1 kinesin-domain-containing protein [Gloeophyllum trabeum ATCC 11539]
MVAAGSITVAVRVRPPSAWEAARLPEPCYDTHIHGDAALATPVNKPITSQSSLRDIVQIVDDRILTFDPPETDRSKAFVERGFMPPGTKRYKDKRFMFDKVFGPEARQVDVYDATAKPLLQPLLDGYNATVFAYGATGCGKTHTISGNENDPGVIYLTMADLFQRIEDRKDEYIVDVTVTFLEIYNEEIRDLLAEPGSSAPRGGLQIREDKVVKVAGLVELRPKSAEEVEKIVLQGNSRRTQSPTHANETSSRSHAVLQVHVTQSPRTASLTEQRTVATLKLTRLLKFSLGGNCKTVMIVCIAPTSNHFDDTHNTLLYADRATKIKTKVVTRNVVNVDRHVGRYVEAINRLNAEVAELKAKLAGKLNTEAEIARRKKVEAKAEVDRARNDMQCKAEQTKASIADGATCSSRIDVAHVRLQIIRSRLAQIESQGNVDSLPSDLAAERELLLSLAKPEEEVLAPSSAYNTRLQRSNNSSNMFDAMLRAVSERRSDKMDEVSIENVKLDGRYHRADIERVKAEAKQEALREAVQAQSELVVNLVGMLGRCNIMLADAGRMLRTALDEGKDGLDGAVRTVSSSLQKLAQTNDGAFTELVGHCVSSSSLSATRPSAIETFSTHSFSFTQRVASGPIISQQAKTKINRRSSSYGSVVGSPGRKSHKNSPRKSARNSLVPYRRTSDKEKEKKKGVQWRDEAGQGDIDDGGLGPKASAPCTSLDGAEGENMPTSSSQRSVSRAGSESEWEDEKTDDNVSMSLPSAPTHDLSTSNGLSGKRITGAKRPRASRLDPSFLKSRGSTLSSLAEDEEDECLPKRAGPLADRNVNMGESSSGSSISSLHIPKGKDRHGSPSKRIPGTPKISSGKGGRRRSSIGPLRNERARRRSSLIPQLSPRASDTKAGSSSQRDEGKLSLGGPRRVPIGNEDMSIRRSPAKRPKRMSLLAPTKSYRQKAVSFADPNSSGDVSFRGAKPSWR